MPDSSPSTAQAHDALLPRDEETLEAFPSETSGTVSQREHPVPLGSGRTSSLLVSLPAPPPVDANQSNVVARDHVVPLAVVAARSFIVAAQRFILSTLGWLRHLVVPLARRLDRATVLRVQYSHRLAVLSATTLIIVVAAAMCGGLMTSPPPSLAPVATSLDAAPWATLPAPPAASVQQPPRRDRAARVDTRAIQSALNRFRDGFSVLDVTRVKQVWPTVDQGALRKQFDGLYDQNVEFDACRIVAAGTRATASCRGSISYVPSARPRRQRTEAKQWQFTLSNTGDRWVITAVAAGLPGQISKAGF